MKTYKQFKEAAALVLPALKAAPYVIPALGAGANILKGMMQSDASDRFKARQRPGRTSSVSDRQREQARQDRRAEAQLRARENTPVSKPNTENIPTTNKPAREKVDPRLERAANQVIDSLRRGNTLSITNRETGLSDSEKRRVGELMDMIKRKKNREKTQQTEKDILDYGRKKEGIAQRPKVDEQMVVPRSIKKKNPLMTVETEKEILMQLSNRPAIYHRARTGKAMPPFSEGYKDPMKRELKLKGQQIINDKEKYVKGTTPVRVKKA